MKYLQLSSSDEAPPDSPGFQHYKAVVIIESIVTPEQQASISRWLVDSGCLYMMAWGADCERWESTVKRANREAFEGPEIPDQSLVITTCHAAESLQDVFWFAKHTALHPCFKIDDTLLLHLSERGSPAEIRAAYAAA